MAAACPGTSRGHCTSCINLPPRKLQWVDSTQFRCSSCKKPYYPPLRRGRIAGLDWKPHDTHQGLGSTRPRYRPCKGQNSQRTWVGGRGESPQRNTSGRNKRQECMAPRKAERAAWHSGSGRGSPPCSTRCLLRRARRKFEAERSIRSHSRCSSGRRRL